MIVFFFFFLFFARLHPLGACLFFLSFFLGPVTVMNIQLLY